MLAGMQHTVLHAVNNGTGTEEEQGFEEGVGHQMESRRHIGARPQRGDHETQLRNRRVGQHALDVVLRDRDGGGKERGELRR